jgi:hypothetical protein
MENCTLHPLSSLVLRYRHPSPGMIRPASWWLTQPGRDITQPNEEEKRLDGGKYMGQTMAEKLLSRHNLEKTQRDGAGDVVLQLKSAWRDGTTHIKMSPLEFMGRLAASGKQ